ncbi:MAG: redoxin domain-containing protein [Phycisphaera sp.]|nr:redoxin domain-containing protein [Phycisphaera sp.]
MKDIDGQDVKLSTYLGKVILMVNVASKCGNTPQYKALEAQYEKYKDKGFVILGFPANNFGGQEPGSNEQIKEFCTSKYDVTFPMFAKVSVKGDDTCPLYKHLTALDPTPGPASGGDITWNFEKFLIDREGKVVARFTPRTKPDADIVTGAIEKALELKTDSE